MRSSSLAALAVLACAMLAGKSARADDRDKEACVAASDQGQTLRDEGKYRLARDQFQACARDACPGLVRRDCERWLNDLETTYPTVVFGARDGSGNDVTNTRVSIDGQVAIDKLDGRPIKVDPGEHVFRYEAPGATAVEQRALIRVGEKNRQLTAIVTVQKAPPPAPVPVPPPRPPEVTPEPPPPEPARSGPPAAGYVLAGVSVVALASFAYFGLTGKSDVDHLRSTCAPSCNPNDVDSAHAKLVVADVSLGVGVLAAAGAAYFLFFAPRSSDGDTSTASHVTFAPTRGGGAVGVVGTF